MIKNKNEKEIKYYLFYFIEKDEDGFEIERSLYAYTDNKKMAKRFKEERNMDKFFEKTLYPSKKEIHDFAVEYKQMMLQRKKLRFYNKTIGSFFTGELIMTIDESLFIDHKVSSLILVELSEHAWINPYIFNEETFNALKTIEYVSFYENIVYGNSNEDPKVIGDEVAIFVHYYGKTLKGSV